MDEVISTDCDEITITTENYDFQFRIGQFKLGQRKEIQQFIFEHLPKELILEEAGIPKPRGGPNLSFLEK